MERLKIVLLISCIVLFSVVGGCVDNNQDVTEGDLDDAGEDLDVPAWVTNYSPIYKVGSGTNHFWIIFPTGGPSASQNVTHLPWIRHDLKEKPVVFVCHTTGCEPCTPQADRVKALRDIYEEDALFYDLDNPFEGYGTASGDTLEKFNNVFYYDANGPPGYIAFTGVFTLVNDNGEVKIGWHTWEGDVQDSMMEKWIKDAIYYYYINSED